MCEYTLELTIESFGFEFWIVNLNSELRQKLSRMVSVFGLSERLIQKLKSAHC